MTPHVWLSSPIAFSVAFFSGPHPAHDRDISACPPRDEQLESTIIHPVVVSWRFAGSFQARIRHMFMTKKQIRDERLQKYRVGFMGMRVPRSFDKDD